ncbi:MAG: DUF177 domain-containing protein [Bacteroidales bacterium]|jgi:uncharacterized metal-binding protein YceD (DUF177 family)|nr:DUF177 domain-containing protein [Bacteroidales bacterium]
MNENFIIPLNGLPQGKSEFRRRADKEFFDSFGNSEILDANLDVLITVEKSGKYLGVDVEVDGTLSVECDRCLERLDYPVETAAYLSVKFGDEPSEPVETKEGEREIVFVPQDNTDLDLSQVVYDYSLLTLPMQRVHEDGKCNPKTIAYLNSQTAKAEEKKEASNSPFAGLKDLLK